MKQETYCVQLRRYLIRARPVHTTEKIHPRLTDVERAAGEFPHLCLFVCQPSCWGVIDLVAVAVVAALEAVSVAGFCLQL